MIKKYHNFIKESKFSQMSPENIKSLRESFREAIIDSDEYGQSMSNMCENHRSDPDSDFMEFQESMDRKGFDIEDIKKLFSPEINSIVNEDFLNFYQRNSLSRSGNIDYYLYRIAEVLGTDKNKIRLGGDGWAEHNEQGDFLIRYAYGYHKTKYGLLILDQLGLSIEEFRRIALESVWKNIQEKWEYELGHFLKSKNISPSHNLLTNVGSSDIKKYIIVEDDRVVIYHVDIAQAVSDSIDWKTEMTPDDVLSIIVSLIGNKGELDYQILEDAIIIT